MQRKGRAAARTREGATCSLPRTGSPLLRSGMARLHLLRSGRPRTGRQPAPAVPRPLRCILGQRGAEQTRTRSLEPRASMRASCRGLHAGESGSAPPLLLWWSCPWVRMSPLWLPLCCRARLLFLPRRRLRRRAPRRGLAAKPAAPASSLGPSGSARVPASTARTASAPELLGPADVGALAVTFRAAQRVPGARGGRVQARGSAGAALLSSSFPGLRLRQLRRCCAVPSFRRRLRCALEAAAQRRRTAPQYSPANSLLVRIRKVEKPLPAVAVYVYSNVAR